MERNGIGVTGSIEEYSVNYQAMLVNGFNGYDDSGVFSGKWFKKWPSKRS